MYQVWCKPVGGALCYVNNPILRLFSHTCPHLSRTRLHTTSDDDQTRRHKSTNNRQTPSPWWWSRSPLQRRGFDESMPLKGRAAFCMIFSTPPSKQFNRFNNLFLLTSCFIEIGLVRRQQWWPNERMHLRHFDDQVETLTRYMRHYPMQHVQGCS